MLSARRRATVLWLAGMAGLWLGWIGHGLRNGREPVVGEWVLCAQVVQSRAMSGGGHQLLVLADNGQRHFIRTDVETMEGDRFCSVLRSLGFNKKAHPWDWDQQQWMEGLGASDQHKEVLRLKDLPRGAWGRCLHRFAWARGQLVQRIMGDGRKHRVGRGWLCGLLTGDKSGLPSRVRRAHSEVGLAHLTAVSGFHVGLVCGAVWLLLRMTSLGWLWRTLGTGVLMWGYVLICGAPPSALRAAGMASMGLMASGTGRRADGLTLLAAAGGVMLMAQPWLSGNLGAQLSFLATAGIIHGQRSRMDHHDASTALAGWWSKWSRGIGSAMRVSLSATLFTAIVAWPAFGKVPLAFLPANLIASPIVCLLMMATALVMVMPGALGEAGLTRVAKAADMVVGGVEWAAVQCPAWVLPLDEWVVQGSALLLLGFFWWSRYRRSRWWMPWFAGLMCCCVLRVQDAAEQSLIRWDLGDGTHVVRHGGQLAVFSARATKEGQWTWKTRSLLDRVSKVSPSLATKAGDHIEWVPWALWIHSPNDTLMISLSP